ncbi:MAG: tyrosine/phenylalanine carboxypeptidase domain-containing protein [Candidatus Nanoarchaeia archaeon]
MEIKKLDRYLTYLNPTNLAKERRIFFKALKRGEKYNPKFEYKQRHFDKKRMLKDINLLENHQGRYQDIIKKAGKRYRIIYNMLNRNFTSNTKLLFREPTREEIKSAREILRGVKRKRANKYCSAEEVAQKLKSHANKYGWDVMTGRSLSKMKTLPGKRKLVISENVEFSHEELRRLRWHEIETHIRREYNNRRLPKEVRNFFNYIETEEGLAVKMEEKHGCKEQLPVYAARLIAVDAAQNSSFYEVYKKIRKWMHEEAAFMITARAKRGLRDTSKPGGLTRDKIYLSGKIKVERYLRKGNMKDLFLGKIGVEDVKFVKSIL